MNTTAWILQGIIAFVFLMAGSIKATQSKAFIKEKLGPWADDFSLSTIKSIGITQILSALGLVVPMLIGKFTFLTPISAIILILIMIGAIYTHLGRGEKKESVPPFLVIIMLCVVLYIRQGLLF